MFAMSPHDRLLVVGLAYSEQTAGGMADLHTFSSQSRKNFDLFKARFKQSKT